ncbi:MAG: hypothetical protein U5N86_04185 [Planctomycetota bacterium]|nr:hypothetical protein [Planctomycetota bacterium]
MEKATTSLEKTWVVSMPLTGRIGRIELEVGDRIRKGEQVASYDLVPMQKSLDEAQAAVGEAQAKIAVNEDDTLENTALTEIEQILRSIEESVKAAEAQVKAARTIMEWAEKKYERFLELHQKGAISQDELDDAKLEYDTAVLGLREQEFTLSALKAFHAAAKIGPSFIRRHIDKKDLKKKGLQHGAGGSAGEAREAEASARACGTRGACKWRCVAQIHLW